MWQFTGHSLLVSTVPTKIDLCRDYPQFIPISDINNNCAQLFSLFSVNCVLYQIPLLWTPRCGQLHIVQIWTFLCV